MLKIENFGFKNPYKHVWGDFAEFWKNRKFWAQIERGGGREIGITQIFGKDFFFGPVTFRKMQIFKKNFFCPEFDPFPRCEIIFINIG